MVVDPQDALLIDLVRSMAARPDYLLPLAAADKQYRDHYYRLNAAALLEDLFFDALGNHVRQTHPELSMERAVGGGAEWDYALGDWRVSHKVLAKVGPVAVHWDATLESTTWTATHSIMIVLSQSDPGRWRVAGSNGEFGVRPIGPRDSPVAGRRVLVASWDTEGPSSTATVLDSYPVEPGTQSMRDVVTFDEIWQRIAERVRAGGSAASIDVLATQSAAARANDGDVLTPLDLELPAGAYLVPAAFLREVAVTGNNRSANLLSRDTVASAMRRARSEGLFVRMPLWFRCYAGSRPPDLYAAQRTEYEGMFSARTIITE